MAYDTAVAVPELWAGSLSGGRKLWFYASADAVTTVRVSAYFTDGYARGMRQGDLIFVCDNDASPITGSLCWVHNSGTTIDISDGVTITGTDSD
jgi:hypothetical protein